MLRFPKWMYIINTLYKYETTVLYNTKSGFELSIAVLLKHTQGVSSVYVYETIYELEKQGFVTTYKTGRARVVSLTKKGMKFAEATNRMFNNWS